MSVEIFPSYPNFDEVTPEIVAGARTLCRASDRVCRSTDIEIEITEDEVPMLKDFRRHLVNFSRARAFGNGATIISSLELDGVSLFGDAKTALHRLVMHGFYEAQHISTPNGYITVGQAIRALRKMGLVSSERTIRSMIRDQVESGMFQELQTSRDQRKRHIMPSYETRLNYETASTVYALCMARFQRVIAHPEHNTAAMTAAGKAVASGYSVDTIAQLAEQWLIDHEGISFLRGKVRPHEWDNRVVGLIDIDEEGGDESDPDLEAVEV